MPIPASISHTEYRPIYCYVADILACTGRKLDAIKISTFRLISSRKEIYRSVYRYTDQYLKYRLLPITKRTERILDIKWLHSFSMGGFGVGLRMALGLGLGLGFDERNWSRFSRSEEIALGCSKAIEPARIGLRD